MRRFVLLGVVLAVFAAVVVGAVSVAAQQGEPSPWPPPPPPIQPVPVEPTMCTQQKLDYNGDGRFTIADVNAWVVWVTSRSCLGPGLVPIPGATCEARFDVDGDGNVDIDDFYALNRLQHSCLMRPSTTANHP